MAMGNLEDREPADADIVYCPQCEEDYNIAWHEGDGVLLVGCGCKSDTIEDWKDRFKDEFTDERTPNSMYQ